MIQPRCRLNVETSMLPLPENGVPGAVGSEPRVVVLVGSCVPLFGGYRIFLAGQLECWPSDATLDAVFNPARDTYCGSTNLEVQE